MSSDTTSWKGKTFVQLAQDRPCFMGSPGCVSASLSLSFVFLSVVLPHGHPESQVGLRVWGLSALSARVPSFSVDSAEYPVS